MRHISRSIATSNRNGSGLVAANGKKIARSTHGYHTKHDVLRSAKQLSLVSYNATIYNVEDNAYEM